MSTISGESYVKFVATLRSVADECDAPVAGGKCLSLYENPETQKELIKSFPDCTIKSVALKTNQFVPDFLVRYEAAKRTKNDELAAYFLKEWIHVAEKALPDNNKMTSVAATIKELTNIFLWPKFQNKKDFADEVSQLSAPLLVKELANQQYLDSMDIPSYALNLLPVSNLNPLEEYIVSTYGPRVKALSFADALRKNLTDEIVALELQRCPNATSADFSDAEKLTEKAFAKGHAKLQEIKLNNTSVSQAIFTNNLFKSLKTIHQDKPKYVFDLTLYCRMNWAEMAEHLQKASSLKISAKAFDILFTGFEGSPSPEALFSLCRIQELLIESHEAGRLTNDYGFFSKLPWAILEAWKRWNASNTDQLILGERLTNLLVNSVGQIRDERVRKTFEESLIYQISHRHTDQIDEHIDFSESDIQKTRILLKTFKEHYHPLLNISCERVRKTISHLYSRSPENNQMWFLQEVYVVLSHLVQANNFFYERRLELKPTELNDYIMACGFIFKAEKSCFFERLIKDLSDTRSGVRAKFLPVPKLILGTLKPADLPLVVRESLLVPLFLNYKGMFEEKLSESLKVKLFEALVNGQLGGFSKQLVEALADLYTKPEELGIWRNRALAVLAHYAGYKWIGPATDVVFFNDVPSGIKLIANEAHQTLAELKVPDHLISELPAAPMAIPSSAMPVPKDSEAID